MKKIFVFATIVSFALIAGCATKTTMDTTVTTTTGVVETGVVAAPDTNAKKGVDIKVAADQKAVWQGDKVGTTHTGTVAILPESLITVNSNNQLLGGKVVIAMNTILENQTGEEGVTKHLKGEDFFDVANHPTAVMVAKSIDGNNVTADLTIKGITKEVTFPVIVSEDGDALLLSAELTLPIKDFNLGQTLLGKIALKDDFSFKLDKVAFIK